MILTTRRRDAALAEQRLLLARRGWQRKTHLLSADIAQHSGLWILGGGFASGAIAARLPVRGIGRALRMLASIASFALRTPLAAAFAETFAHKPPASTDPLDTDA